MTCRCTRGDHAVEQCEAGPAERWARGDRMGVWRRVRELNARGEVERLTAAARVRVGWQGAA